MTSVLRRKAAYFLAICVLTLWLPGRALAAESLGQVTYAGLPVPGATVTATRGDTRQVTVTNYDGVYRFADLTEGTWTIDVQMVGFAKATREIRIPPDGPSPVLELALLSFEELSRDVTLQAPPPPTPAPDAGPARTPASTAGAATAAAATAASGFQRANVNARVSAPPIENPPATDPGDDNARNAADGLLINGSVNNGASTPFAQPRAFGNSRPGQRSLYTGAFATNFGSSTLDARPFSFAPTNASQPEYNDLQFNGTVGGPMRLPGVKHRLPTFFVGVQRSSTHNATTALTLVPTEQERNGDFSASIDRAGRPVTVRDPATGLPFDANAIPSGRISPQAASLLAFYPQPNIAGAAGYNYQRPIVSATEVSGVNTRLTYALNNRDSLVGSLSYSRTRTESANVFNFVDTTKASSADVTINWSHRLTQFTSLRTNFQLTHTTTQTTPFFANVLNVSGAAGINGNNQDPVNWGPPSLSFASGIAGLSTAQYTDNSSTTPAVSSEMFWSHGRHNLTFGGGFRRAAPDFFTQQDARGGFAFTGVATGSDFADFLLGLPRTSSIAYGNPDKYFRSNAGEAYVSDDWRVTSTLTLTLGVRWEYESPITELQNRLVNLDVTSDFSAASPVLASDPVGTLTGHDYGRSLVTPDYSGIQPRLAFAWRPLAGSSVVVRGGYGIYRNTNVYQSLALVLAQQPPLSATSNVESTLARPLTLADGFVAATGAERNTYALDPDFRVSSSHNWQVSVQRDFPMSLVITGTYLGSHGVNLIQAFLPNSLPPGSVNPCPTCPVGFVYLTSGATSLRNAGQVQIRRRLRNGLTATVQYTLAKATDNASGFSSGAASGGSLGGVAIAQNWLDLDAERGPSSFDQRHQLSVQVQYTTGAGITGGTLIDGWKGRLFKDWTFASQLTTGSGTPFTPVSLSSVSGVTGTVRAALTGAPTGDIPDGYYLNPAAYAVTLPGAWGDAGRNSLTGPNQFQLGAAVGRTFRWGPRFNFDWRLDVSNILNRVTYASVTNLVGSPQFGLPNRANEMRKLQSTLRVRF